jgi:hypothetical protein
MVYPSLSNPLMDYNDKNYHCLMGIGDLIMLRKQSDGWKIVSKRMLWIS